MLFEDWKLSTYMVRSGDTRGRHTSKWTGRISLIICPSKGMRKRVCNRHKICTVVGTKRKFLNFKLSPCSLCSMFSFWYFPGVWGLNADVSDPSIRSIFKGRCLWRWNAGEIPKRKHTTRRGNFKSECLQENGLHRLFLFSFCPNTKPLLYVLGLPTNLDTSD